MSSRSLTGAALFLGFFASLLLAFLPPRPWRQATREGAAFINFTGKVTRAGKVWWALSYSGPALLAVAYVLQLIVWLRQW
jgi:hypothetical protein